MTLKIYYAEVMPVSEGLNPEQINRVIRAALGGRVCCQDLLGHLAL
jgi:hypothetical protein